MSEPSLSTNPIRRDHYRLTGEVFSQRYRIEEYVGAGSFGAVYRAVDLRLNRPVAVKILKPDVVETDASASELFQREALTAGRLVHPHIVAVTDTGEEQGFAYLVMEWLEGATLEDVLRAKHRLSPQEATEFLRPIAEALQVAHDEGIVHRDIKPSNIHISKTGFVKVLDFGIAKIVGASAAEASRVAGTLNYMSPEQLNGEAIDRRADIYSLGVMLYRMLAGTLPFKGDSQGEVMLQHLSATPPPLCSLCPDIAPQIAKEVERSLSKNAIERPQTTLEFYQNFVAALTKPVEGNMSNAQTIEMRTRDLNTQKSQAQQTQIMPDQFIPDTISSTAAESAPTAINEQSTLVAPNIGFDKATLAQSLTRTGAELRSPLFWAIGWAFLIFIISAAVGFLLRWLEMTQTPYAYDEFVLELIFIATRDAMLGAFLGVMFSELISRKAHWKVADRHWIRVLLAHGVIGAVLVLLPFALLRTSLYLLPLGLSLLLFFVGMIIGGIRLAFHYFLKS